TFVWRPDNMMGRLHLVTLLVISFVLTLSCAAFAQAPAPGAPAGAPGAAGTQGSGDMGSVSNTGASSAPGTVPLASSNSGAGAAADTGDASSKSLGNTGGEPWLMVLAGSLVCGSALLMRRKVGSNLR
ncbi:MAG TPA: hypothetical protein VHI52_11180, partial [Verrucomicrobiae bacterium]|nr:hypothetical protein [Verrucomicrobiae bacterium]